MGLVPGESTNMHYSANNFVPHNTNAIYRVKRIRVGLNCMLGSNENNVQSAYDALGCNATSIDLTNFKESPVLTIKTFSFTWDKSFYIFVHY